MAIITNINGTLVNLTDDPDSFKNKIINGDFDIWQRSTSQATGGIGSADRWYRANGGLTGFTHSKQTFAVGQTDVPDNPTNFARTVVVSGGTTNSAYYESQRIEDVSTLSGEIVTVSFYAKADASKNESVEMYQNFGSSGSANVFISPTKVAVTTSWSKKEVTFSVPSVSGKTIGAGSYTVLRFWYDAGSDLSVYTDSLGNQSGTFDIAHVQLELGAIATSFEKRPITTEQQLCHKYAFAPLGGKASTGLIIGPAFADTSTSFRAVIVPPVPMRVVPTLTFLGASTNLYVGLPGSTAATGIALGANSAPDCFILTGSYTSLTANKPYFLYRPGTTENPVFDAEL